VPLFFFHIHNGFGTTPDEEGRELADEAMARDEAVKGARSLMSAEVEEGCLDLGGRIEVTDADNRPVAMVHFREVLIIKDGSA